MISSRWGRIAGILIAAVVLPPVLVVVLSGFNAQMLGAGFTFTVDAWQAVFSNTRSLSAIITSFLLTVRVPIGLAIAFAFAWALIRLDIPCKRTIEYGLWFAFFVPTLPLMLGWILLLDGNYGIIATAAPFLDLEIYSFTGILWVHLTASTIPVIVIFLRPALQHLDVGLEEAALLHGATRWQVWRTVTLPLVAPAVATAFLAGMIKGLEVFEIEQILGLPAGIQVFSTRIFALLAWDPPIYGEAMALSTIFLALMILAAVVYVRFAARRGETPTIGLKGRVAQLPPRDALAWLFFAAIAFYFLIGLLLPLAMVVMGSFSRLFGFFDLANPLTLSHWADVLRAEAFSRAIRTSVFVGLGVAGIGTVVYGLLGWAMCRAPSRSRSWWLVGVLVWIPWAVPGILLGVAYLMIFLNAPFVRHYHGTIVPMIVVLLVMTMPLAVAMLQSAAGQIPREFEEAGLMAGASRLATLRTVTLPLMAPMMVSVFLFALMQTLRDISATVLLATPSTRTLPLLMFSYASGGRLEAASVVGVIIAVTALIITVAVLKMARRLGFET
ncbi:MAG: iron ABC transporter permease [Actinobacteria bacterium]|nr:iron ABC transporter permease [Actinomycetota bacterium]